MACLSAAHTALCPPRRARVDQRGMRETRIEDQTDLSDDGSIAIFTQSQEVIGDARMRFDDLR